MTICISSDESPTDEEKEKEGEEGSQVKDTESENSNIANEQSTTDKDIIEEADSEDSDKESDKLAPSVDGTDGKDDSIVLLNNGTTDSVVPHNRGNPKLRLVLRPLCEDECSKCAHDHSERPGFIPNSRSLDSFSMGQPVCRLPSPFLNYSLLSSGYCADTVEDCTEIERRGMNFCEVKGQSTVLSYTKEGEVSMETMPSLGCSVDDTTHQSDCLKKLQEELRMAEQRRTEQREKMMMREKERKGTQKILPKTENPEKPVSDAPSSGGTDNPTSEVEGDPSHKADKSSTAKTKESIFSKMFHTLEFLPYNPLPIDLDELIFPEKSRPLQIFDDPYWPNKASCIRLVETLGAASSSFSSYTGTYLSPNAKGAK